METTTPNAVSKDDDYATFEKLIQTRVAFSGDGALFETAATPEELWNAYLDGFPSGRHVEPTERLDFSGPSDKRQYYNCHSCKKFIQTYGGLVKIDGDGTSHSLLWNIGASIEEVRPPAFFANSVRELAHLVARSRVTGVFLSSEVIFGTPVTKTPKDGRGPWTHLSGLNPKIFDGRLKTASQAMAEKREDYKMLLHALADYPPPVVEQALKVLRADAVDRSEKTLGVAEWFYKVHGMQGPTKNNQIWAAVATAPPGFCHVRSTMTATLMDDIKAGISFDEISRRWADKMRPDKYQRPTAAPTEGAIEQAEKLVAKLGVEKSLERRFATLDDVLAKVWTPTPKQEDRPQAQGSVFDHLKKQAAAVKEVELPATTMTFEKFSRTALSSAKTIEILVPNHGNFYGLLTAVDLGAPAILQWDGLEGHPRNPASAYVYIRGSTSTRWNLTPGWRTVTAIFLPPHQWQDKAKFTHQGTSQAFFAIDGCQDTEPSGLALFPEILKSEFHGIRSVIEKHSNSRNVSGVGNANGLGFHNSSPVTVRVNGSSTYVLDRWD